MTCEEYMRLLNQKDGVSESEREQIREHMTICERCAEETIRFDLARLDEGIEVPDTFASAWRRQIREDQPMEVKQKKPFALRNWLAAAAAVVFLVGGTLGTRDLWLGQNQKSASYDNGAGSTGAYSTSMPRAAGANDILNEESYPMLGMASAKMSADTDMDTGSARESKIIREASFTLKTQAFDDDYRDVLALVEALGGRVEYSNVSGDTSTGTARVARLTLRVPTDRLDDFIAGAETVGSVTNMTQSAQDVSDTYYDLQSRLDTQNLKLKRLNELMSMTTDVAELIEVESAIADTQYMIDSYQSSLKGYDSRVQDSEVTVTIREVKASETTQATLGEKIGQAVADSLEGFVHFMQDMLIFLLAALPWLLAAAVVTTITVIIVKKKKGGK